LEKVLESSDEFVLVLSSSYRVVDLNALMIKLLGIKPHSTSEQICQSMKIKSEQELIETG